MQMQMHCMMLDSGGYMAEWLRESLKVSLCCWGNLADSSCLWG